LIVNIGLEPAALFDISVEHIAQAAAPLQRLVREAIQAYGYLVVSNSNELREFSELVKSSALSQQERQLWDGMLSELTKAKRVRVLRPELANELSVAASASDLVAHAALAGESVLVLSAEHFGSVFPTSADGASIIDARTTVSTPMVLTEVQPIDRARQLERTGNHPRGTTREQIWDDLFASPARKFSRVEIFDRYLFGELSDRDRRWNHRQPEEHLIWFLDKLDRSATSGMQVRLYGELGDRGIPARAEEMSDLLLNRWERRGTGISTIEVAGARWAGPERQHNRHVRFGESLGYMLFEGLDRLRSPTVDFSEGFSWGYRWAPLSVVEMVQRETALTRMPGASRHAVSL